MASAPQPARLFPGLAARPDVSPFPHEMGCAGGPMDGGYVHLSNITLPAGYTYFAQFALHDLTCGEPPRLDLRCIYGGGPDASPALYDPRVRGRLRTGKHLGPATVADIPRDAGGRAVMGDPRNDHTLILAQFHAVFVHLHNAVLESLEDVGGEAAFLRSRRAVRHVYQRMVVYDLLRRIAGDDLLYRKLESTPAHPRLTALPVEFSLAAARFGHAMVKPRYRLNAGFHRTVFTDAGDHTPLADLRGQPLEAHAVVEWENFFPIGSQVAVQASSRLNPRICRPLFEFPLRGARSALDRSIPYRTLVAAQCSGVPSGQDAARACGADPLDEESLWDAPELRGQPAPLWYYVLREAEVQQHGERLGELGAGIVTDVVLRALASDPESFMNDPGAYVSLNGERITDVGGLLRLVLDHAAGAPRWAPPM